MTQENEPTAERSGEGRPGGRTVTSYDVARAAGVSQSAVSRCLTEGGSVSPATRERIMKAVDELGYRPNAIARSLITKRSNMVAVVVANLDFLPQFTAQLSRSFTERGFHLLLFTLDHETESDRVVDQIWQYRVDGVIAAVRLPQRHVDLLRKRRMPVVFVNRMDDDSKASTVCCDHAEGERTLVDRLVAAGHRRFGIVRGPVESGAGVRRVECAVRRLGDHNISGIRFADGDFSYPSGREALHRLLDDGHPPEAVICANDMMALGVMDAARHDLRIAIPGDLSVVGFDGLAQAAWSSYDLVTVRQRTREMVEAAVDMLIARIEDPSLGVEKRVFPGELVPGSSARIA